MEVAWRRVATGFAFAFAGTTALGVAFIAVPLIHLVSQDPDIRARRIQRIVHGACGIFVQLLQITRLFRFEFHETKRLREPGILVVANHPTLIDALVLLSQMPQAYCVVKRNFHQNRFFGRSAAAAGYIASDDGRQMVDTCVHHLRQGRSVIIFPEGTRSPADDLGPFERGSAHIALRSGCQTVPVTIRSSPATLYRGNHWWDVPTRRPVFSVHVGKTFQSGCSSETNLSMARSARSYTASLRAHFGRDLDVG